MCNVVTEESVKLVEM